MPAPAECVSGRSIRSVGSLVVLLLLLLMLASVSVPVAPTHADAAVATFAGVAWSSHAPRDEIRPRFALEPAGGPRGAPRLIIDGAGLPGAHGWWQASFPVTGGRDCRFQVLCRTTGVEVPRRSAVVRIHWRDGENRPVSHREPSPLVLKNWTDLPRAEAEYPREGTPDADGWSEISAAYHVPPAATQAIVELRLQWTTGLAEFAELSFSELPARRSRKVRLATAHLQPRSVDKSPLGNCQAFEPLIRQAAEQNADLLVLPETLTYFGTGKSFAEVAEPIPGPSTAYFGSLARQHDLYLVAGLVERDGHLIYNTAALIGPDGALVGKYRKVTLPRGEVEAGLQPGDSYPVFQTRFGKVGMMICYDGFFPEVARELTIQGAEVIAWPVWGCNPLLASARACENHVYLISSTYNDAQSGWILSAVYGHDGRPLVHAEQWGTVVVAEVDLDQPTHWHSLGDFRAELHRHRPPTAAERGAAASATAATGR